MPGSPPPAKGSAALAPESGSPRCPHLPFLVLLLAFLALPLASGALAQEPPAAATASLVASGHAELAERLSGLLRPPSVPGEAQVRELLAAWEAETAGPENGDEWLALAQLWLRAGSAREAEAALSRAASAGAPSGLVHLAAAQAAFLGGDAEAGADRYRAGCAAAGGPGAEGTGAEVARAYWKEIEPLATPEEQAEWEARLSGAEPGRGLCRALERFWNRRAARSAMTVGERIGLHYERVRYARPRHARRWPQRTGMLSSTVAGRPLSNRIGRPKEAAFDDRGLIYLRMGPPDRTAGFGGFVPHPVVGPTCYHPNDSWAYDVPEGVRVYHFSPLEGTADWWLIENLEDLYACGDPDFVRTVRLLPPPRFPQEDLNRDRYQVIAVGQLQPGLGGGRPPIGQIAYLVLPDLYLSRQGLDSRYSRLGYRFFDPSPDTIHGQLKQGFLGAGEILDAQQALSRERQWTWADARHAIETVPERPAVARDARLRFEVLQFRGSGGEVRAWWNGIVDAAPIRPDTLPDGRLRYRVEAALALLDEGEEEHRRLTRTIELTAAGPLPKGAALPVRIPVTLAPGRYEFTLLVREPSREERPRGVDGEGSSAEAKLGGNYVADSVRVRGFAAAVPEISDIAVAPDSGGEWTAGGGIYLRPSPAHATGPDGVAHVYYEVYGVSPGAEFETRVRLEPARGGEPFTLTYPGRAPPGGGPLHGYLRLELGKTKPGAYRMTVTVRDVATGTVTLPYETAIVVESG